MKPGIEIRGKSVTFTGVNNAQVSDGKIISPGEQATVNPHTADPAKPVLKDDAINNDMGNKDGHIADDKKDKDVIAESKLDRKTKNYVDDQVYHGDVSVVSHGKGDVEVEDHSLQSGVASPDRETKGHHATPKGPAEEEKLAAITAPELQERQEKAWVFMLNMNYSNISLPDLQYVQAIRPSLDYQQQPGWEPWQNRQNDRVYQCTDEKGHQHQYTAIFRNGNIHGVAMSMDDPISVEGGLQAIKANGGTEVEVSQSFHSATPEQQQHYLNTCNSLGLTARNSAGEDLTAKANNNNQPQLNSANEGSPAKANNNNRPQWIAQGRENLNNSRKNNAPSQGSAPQAPVHEASHQSPSMRM